ncbi:TonB-dependent receptor [Erythrobacter sp. SG61-1L]|uniref:TonB-dependent receptor n=1 Tax=Erythrobacter sp. SG61-1L TaxID=1603897 RepID=UPI0019D6CB77|nr:TonB-dependent receptor [Erythrobacter sp. SG61-1L]
MKKFAIALLSMTSVPALMLAGSPANAKEQPATRDFNIPAQPLASALLDFSRVAGVAVSARSELTQNRNSPGVSGKHTAEKALQLLLTGTGLTYRTTPGGGYSIVTNPGPRSQAETGTLSGKVLDPVTGEYKRNAIIRVTTSTGEKRSTSTGEGGQYRLLDVPAGETEITVAFTGYPDKFVTVDTPAGKALEVDFVLAAGGEELAANEIVVTGVREGDAKAIMSQRNSMDITNSLSSESFGEVSEGNIGEFLKFMPGVITQNQGAADDSVRYVGLRGLPPEYTSVTVNGIAIAGADANSGSSTSRSFSFEQASLSSIDSIEISKTVSADVDANAPAGTINLRTKRAFDRKGRRIVVSLNATTQSDLWDSKQAGPGEDRGNGRFRPGGSIEYSDVMLDGRLGIVASASLSRVHTELETIQHGWNYTATAKSPDPIASATMTNRVTAQEVSRISSNLTLDFKATDELTLSLMGIYNRSYNLSEQRAYVLTSGARSRGLEGEPAFDYTTLLAAGTASLRADANTIAKVGTGVTVTPSFEYRGNYVTLDGNFFYTNSNSSYDPMGKEHAVFTTTSPTASGNYSAQRSEDYLATDWTIQQVSGADWSDPASYSASSIVINAEDGRSSKVERTGGALNLAYDVPGSSFPIMLKAGGKVQMATYLYENRREASRYTYTGPLSTTEFLIANQSYIPLNFNESGLSLLSSSGSSAFYMPSNYLIGQYFLDHPDEFTPVMTATNYYNANIGNSRHFDEDTYAAYAMATAQPLEWLAVRAGLRWEQTRTAALEPDPLSAAEVIEAGYAVSSTTGQATTIEGLQYQYESRPRVPRKGNYDYFFPSASAKISFTDSLDLQLGYSRTIRRPEVDVLAGVWSVNETTQTVTVPNPGLTPELSDNYSVRLVKYFEPVGLIGINYFRNELKGAFQTQEFTAQEFGYTGTEYADYTFRTTATVGEGTISIQGVELELNYSLERLLPKPFKGLTLRGSYTYTHPNQPISLTPENMFTMALAYKSGPVRLYLNTVWTDDRPATISTGTYDKARWDVNLSGNYRFRRGLEGFFSVRNLLNRATYRLAPGVTNDAGSVPDHVANYNNAGVSGTIGVRATF